MKKTIILSILIIVLSIIEITSINAVDDNGSTNLYKRMCLSYGESVPSQSIKRYTCYSDLCQICVNQYNFPAHPGYCNSMSGCSILNKNESIDNSAPNITIKSPIQMEVYNSRKVLFEITSNKPAILYYKDNNNLKGQWKKLAYFKNVKTMLSFKDGYNSVTIKAMDKKQNSVEQEINFYVDSIKPKIKTEPQKGFSAGEFILYYDEENPKTITLDYGNLLIGYRKSEINISNCIPEKALMKCTLNIDLKEYNNQKIEYWFTLTDIGNNTITSKSIVLDVDTKEPNITNLDDMIKIQGKYVSFNIDVDENNFESAYYFDYSQIKPKWKMICNRLKYHICSKKETFSPGEHIIDIQLTDMAGNAISVRKEFTI